MCTHRKINPDLSNKIDNLLISCDSTDSSQMNNLFFERVDLSIKSEINKLPEVLTIMSSYVPACRFVPIKFRPRWSQLLSGILHERVEAPDNETIWQKFSWLENAFYAPKTTEAKSNSAIKTNVSLNVLIVGTPVNMGSFGQKLSPWNNQKVREFTALKKYWSERKCPAYKANLAELLKF